jgi:hypothetical protein
MSAAFKGTWLDLWVGGTCVRRVDGLFGLDHGQASCHLSPAGHDAVAEESVLDSTCASHYGHAMVSLADAG